jgi:hypothetical protein
MRWSLCALALFALPVQSSAQESEAPASSGLDHVAVGQTYHWTLQNNVTQVWEVRAVEEGRVDYAVSTLLDLGEGPQPVGDPSLLSWEPAAAVSGQAEGVTVRRETVVISGHELECRVVESSGVNAVTWIPSHGDRTVFPPLVKSTLDGKSVMELTRIEPRGPKPESEDRAPSAAGPSAAAPARPTTPKPEPGAAADLSHVKAGQVYVYEMLNGMRGEWAVLEVSENSVRYTMTIFMDMGQGPEQVGTPAEQEWAYRPTQGTAWQENMKTRREVRTVSGVQFDCLVIESEGWTSWLTMTPGSDAITTFPGLVESSDQEGNSTMKLVEVRQP